MHVHVGLCLTRVSYPIQVFSKRYSVCPRVLCFFLQLTSLRLATTCKVFAWCTGCCNSKLHIYIAQYKCKYPIQSRGVKSEDLSTESSEFRCHKDEREQEEENFNRSFHQ